MNINEALMISTWPNIDLHGFDRESARVAVNDFVNDNIKQKKEYIIIIHGKGSGVIREATKKALLKNKNVLEFKTTYFNEGATIAKLKVNN